MNVKSRLVVLSLSLSVLGLAACASMEEKTSYVPPENAPAAVTIVDTDVAYMAEVERLARRRNMDVVWVNPPTKRTVMVRDIHH